MGKKWIIDCDAGGDDASALFMAAKAHKLGAVELVAITAVSGNTPVKNVVANIARTLTASAVGGIPIYEGCFSALVDPIVNDQLHWGADGFGDSVHDSEPDLKDFNREEHAVNALCRIVRESPGEITLITLGPLTNVAMAMRMDEQFASGLKDFYIMGGNTEGVGNIAVAAEFNFHCDPEAAYIVLNNTRCPTYIVCLELCAHKIQLDWGWRIEDYGGVDSAQCRLINKAEAHIIDRSRNVEPHFLAHDQVAMAVALDRRIVQRSSSCFATVELSGRLTRGQMIVDRKSFLEKLPNVTVIETVDRDLLKTMMLWSVDHPDAVDYAPPV